MSVKLAVAPIAWSNSDLPELGGETSLVTCLRESREAGFTGTETGIKYPMDPEVLGPILKKYGIQLASGWFSGTLRECSVDQEFEDISLTMGKSPLETFWRVTLPLALPSVVGGLALAWARAISEFGATLMFAGNFPGRTQTLPLAIMNALEVDLGAALALAMILVIIAIAVLGTLGYLARNRWRLRL